MELAQVLGTDLSPPDTFPVPKTLEDLLRARIAGLPSRTLQALAFVAALGTLTDALLQRAGVEPSALHPAVAAQVIDRVNGTIRFTHPLLASVLYRDLGEGRWPVHATVARLSDDPWSARATSPCRRTSRTPRSQPCSTTQQAWRWSAGRWRPRPNSPSTP